MAKYYLTTPIYYANGQPHIGHAYTTIAADTLARWKRFLGEETFFLTGTDEHGSKIAAAAAEKGLSPQELADQMAGQFDKLWKILDIKYDRFIRTTEPEHEKVVREIFLKLYRKGDLYPGKYEGYYCVPCEHFLNPSEGNICPDCKRPAEKITEETFFFRLSAYQKKIQDYFAQNPEFIQPERVRKEINNMMANPLPDLSFTRDCPWGVKIPTESAGKLGLSLANGSVTIYVWFDALLNYLSGVGGPDADGFRKFWPPDLQLVGKDIIRFHYIIWPAILMALDLPLPKRVFTHGWWLSGGEKMSKSRGNTIDPLDFCNRFGPDALRYFLLAEVPFGLDGDFTETAFQKRYNSDLANDLGNLIHRFNRLIRTDFNGRVPRPADGGPLAEKTLSALPELAARMETLDFSGFLEKFREVVTAANRCLDEQAPWRKGPNAADVLYNLTETSRILSIYIEPFLPKTAVLIRQQLGLQDLPSDRGSVKWGLTPPNAAVIEAAPLFPRLK